MTNNKSMLEKMNSFDRAEREQGLLEASKCLAGGPSARKPVRDWMNLHCHTFHSFNSSGWSPTRLVWEALQDGWEVFGSVDFDVLDAVGEVLEAGDELGIKTVAGLESRVYIKEYEKDVINSPGEPGVSYFMLTGVYQLPESGTQAAQTLASLKAIAQERNQVMISRINPRLGKASVDYTADLLPMTPSGNPTERHLVEAYDRKARELFQEDSDGLASFWAEKFGMVPGAVAELLGKTIPFQETLRSKLMKKGGPGYIDPDPSRFPTVEAMIELGLEIGAIPTIAWLDGTTPGESDMRRMIEFLSAKGVGALNIIPDRNWNLKNPDEKALKIAKLADVVEAAREFHLPLSVGTEMNKAGQPFIDAFDAPELQPFVADFRKGARALWGHTLLARALDFGWVSAKAQSLFGDDRKARLEFFSKVGERYAPGKETLAKVRGLTADPSVLLA